MTPRRERPAGSSRRAPGLAAEPALPLDAGPPHRRGGFLRALPRVVLGWLPAACALGLLVQLSWLGLRPALAERARLEAWEAHLDARVEALEARHADLAAAERALDDPIFRERVHRARRSTAFPAGLRPLALPRTDS